MSRRSKQHTDEFKAEAVALVEGSGKSVPEIAEELGINARTLYHWIAANKPGSVPRSDLSENDLAAILDLFSRRIIGWAMSAQCDALLVQNALHMALSQRQRHGDLLHHSDRGSQYAAHAYQALLAQHHVTASMSRKGNCYDNAVMESFFHTLKSECVDLHLFQSHSHARSVLFHFMEVYYNRQRLHSTLGYCTPAAFEAASSQ